MENVSVSTLNVLGVLSFTFESVTDLHRTTFGRAPPSSDPIFFILWTVFETIWPNNKLAPLWEILSK